MNLDEITKRLRETAKEFHTFCLQIDDSLFFEEPEGKWSVAQNVKHLIISVSRTKLAYQIPKFITRLITGKPNRLSRTYEALVDKYKTKLLQGGRAGGPYIPKRIPAETGKEKLLAKFLSLSKQLARIMERKWTDPQLDNYLAPHPLLGKITLRELGYFTIYHTLHHLEIIKQRRPENT
jgi:hypothetical protein